MSDTGVPEFSCRYSKLSRLGFAIVFLIFGYGGIGMLLGLVDIEADQRGQQVLIGLLFLGISVGFGFVAYEMFRAGTATILSFAPDGLWDRRLTRKPIPWEAVGIVKGPEPGFLERLVIPGKTRGAIVIEIAPGTLIKDDLAWSWSSLFNRVRYPGAGKMQIFHRTLDMSHASLSTALALALEATQGRTD